MYGNDPNIVDYVLPRLPDVHKYKAQGKLDVLSWNLKKGDVVILQNALHFISHSRLSTL